MMRERRYGGGDIRIRSPPVRPPPPTRSNTRDREYSPPRRREIDVDDEQLPTRSRFRPSLGSVHAEPERSRRGRDYDRHFDDDGDIDGQSRRLSQFNESLPRGDPTSMKFQWKHLLGEQPTKSSGNNANHSFKDSIDDRCIGSNRVSTERNYQGSPFLDKDRSRTSVDEPVSVQSGRARIYSSYPLDVGFGMPSSRNLNYCLHKDEDLGSRRQTHLDNKLPGVRELYKGKENSLVYSKGDSDYMTSISQSKAESLGLSKAEFSGSYMTSLHVPSDGIRLNTEMIPTPADHHGYGQKLLVTSVDHDVRSYDMQNYPLAYLSPSEGKHGDYTYPKGQKSDRGNMGTMSDGFYGNKMLTVGEEYGHRDLLRTSILDPVVDRIDECSHREHLTESRMWGHSPLLGQPIPNNLDASGLLHQTMQNREVLGYGSTHLEYEREVHQDHESLLSGEDYGYDTGGGPWPREESSDMFPMAEYDSRLDGIDGSPQQRLTAGETSLHELSRTTLKRKRGLHKKSGGHDLGHKISSNGKGTSRIHDQGVADEQWTGEDRDPLFPSKKLRFSHPQYGKTGRASNEKANNRISNRNDWSTAGNPSASMPRHLRKPRNSGGRDIKKRLGPGPQNIYISHPLVKSNKPSVKKRLGPGPQKVQVSLPWLKNYKPQKSQKRTQDGSDGGLHIQEEDPSDSYVTPAKAEPPGNSEDFKQLVHTSFFRFIKQLNENAAHRRRFVEHGKAGSLMCCICGSNSEEFVDTESLVMHAFTSPKVGLRSQHLGFHKALCVLMGWKSAMAPNIPWVREILSDAETLALREDLLIWPPVVIIHNSSIKNNNPAERVIVSIEVLETTLKDMGFGGKIKVCRGKAANQSIMVVRFNGTFSGLQEAERLHKFYAETKHGRAEFQHVNFSNSSSTGESPKASTDMVEHVLYGYLGIAGDLDKLDFEMKKRCLVKSKKEIQDIADAPLKTE